MLPSGCLTMCNGVSSSPRFKREVLNGLLRPNDNFAVPQTMFVSGMIPTHPHTPAPNAEQISRPGYYNLHTLFQALHLGPIFVFIITDTFSRIHLPNSKWAVYYACKDIVKNNEMSLYSWKYDSSPCFLLSCISWPTPRKSFFSSKFSFFCLFNEHANDWERGHRFTVWM